MKGDILILPLPPSINATYKTGKGRFYKDERAVAWEEEVLYLLKTHQWTKNTLSGRLYVSFWWFFKRERDISSGVKILEDVLQKAGVYKNDSQIYQEVLHKDFDIKNPRVEIEIRELE